jgi:hypothetical protein
MVAYAFLLFKMLSRSVIGFPTIGPTRPIGESTALPFIPTDEMSAIHKLGEIIKIEVNDYIRLEVIRNV